MNFFLHLRLPRLWFASSSSPTGVSLSRVFSAPPRRRSSSPLSLEASVFLDAALLSLSSLCVFRASSSFFSQLLGEFVHFFDGRVRLLLRRADSLHRFGVFRRRRVRLRTGTWRRRAFARARIVQSRAFSAFVFSPISAPSPPPRFSSSCRCCSSSSSSRSVLLVLFFVLVLLVQKLSIQFPHAFLHQTVFKLRKRHRFRRRFERFQNLRSLVREDVVIRSSIVLIVQSLRRRFPVVVLRPRRRC